MGAGIDVHAGIEQHFGNSRIIVRTGRIMQGRVAALHQRMWVGTCVQQSFDDSNILVVLSCQVQGSPTDIISCIQIRTGEKQSISHRPIPVGLSRPMQDSLPSSISGL